MEPKDRGIPSSPASNDGGRAQELDSLLLPGTTDEVRALYHSLPAMAESRDFGLLEDDVIVLDTETTGLSFKDCELIEIAAARLNGRVVVERFQTFVKPTTPIPEKIQKLTGIHEIDVRDAPSATEAVSALADFAGGAPVLAHNATFDRTFVEKVKGGRAVSDTWIDTLALSRIALPRLRNHRLADMAKAFGCDSVTHRAMDDVDALAGMWRIILCGLAIMPAGLLGRLADMHPDIDWPYRPVLSMLARETAGASFSLKNVRHELVSAQALPHRDDALAEGKMLEGNTEASILNTFASDGPLASMYERYESRPEQVQMAREVRDALVTGSNRAIEAGTGVGKSLAYLIPSIEFARLNNITIGVATKTNALSDQLTAHELPLLDDALPGGVKYTVLKGYDHYPCLERLERATYSEAIEALVGNEGVSKNVALAERLTAIAVNYTFACQSPEGDLDALGIRWKLVPRAMLTVTPSECTRAKCPFYPNECFVHGARRRAASCDVVVTNHSLLLRNIAADNAILPPVRHWIVDEAHGFESEARRQWAVEVSAEGARRAFEQLGGTKTGVIHSMLVNTAGLEGGTLVAGLLTKAAASVARTQLATEDVFTSIHALSDMVHSSGGYETSVLWVDGEVRNSSRWSDLEDASRTAHDKLEETVKFLTEADAAAGQADARLAGELADGTRLLKDLLEGIDLIVLKPTDEYVYSAEVYRQTRRMGQERLVAERLDVGSALAERWMPEMRSVVYTSATIAVGDSFEHFNHAVGFDCLPASSHEEIRLDSGYDFDNNMAVVVARDMPAPNERGYVDALADLLYDVHVGMSGSVLTLFTNRREMEGVYSLLQPRLQEQGLGLICQERNSSPRYLRERFVDDKSLSLFALKSFWEGFDAAGDTLRCVVIPKLPFASPRDPLVQERESRDRRSWWKYSLPDAVLEVKQAAGRLIRSSDDRGVLILADSRVATKRYGARFLESMPSSNRTSISSAFIGQYLQSWRRSHER